MADQPAQCGRGHRSCPAANRTRGNTATRPTARRGEPRPDFTTTQRLDLPVAPSVTANDALLQFLFSQAPTRYDELKKRAEAGEPLTGFTLEGVTLTFNVDADYEVRPHPAHAERRRRSSKAAIPQLKSTYVALGAHYDHVGYADAEVTSDRDAPALRAGSPRAQRADRIWNGADDDGSGTVALMAMARAFAQGPRPRRSLLFVWHAGEERGLLGSRYFVDYPTVPHRSRRRAVEHRHDRPQPRRQAERGQHGLSRGIGSDQQRTARAEPGGEPLPRCTAHARLRDERSGGSRAALLPKRSLQLRREGDSGHLLHDRAASGLPREHRRGVEDRVPEADARRAAGVRNRAGGWRTSIMRRCATSRDRAPGRELRE